MQVRGVLLPGPRQGRARELRGDPRPAARGGPVLPGGGARARPDERALGSGKTDPLRNPRALKGFWSRVLEGAPARADRSSLTGQILHGHDVEPPLGDFSVHELLQVFAHVVDVLGKLPDDAEDLSGVLAASYDGAGAVRWHLRNPGSWSEEGIQLQRCAWSVGSLHGFSNVDSCNERQRHSLYALSRTTSLALLSAKLVRCTCTRWSAFASTARPQRIRGTAPPRRSWSPGRSQRACALSPSACSHAVPRPSSCADSTRPPESTRIRKGGLYTSLLSAWEFISLYTVSTHKAIL